MGQLYSTISYCCNKLCDFLNPKPPSFPGTYYYRTFDYTPHIPPLNIHSVDDVYRQTTNRDNRDLLKPIIPGYPTKENYVNYFSILLRTEEDDTLLKAESYNMKSVTMKYIPMDTFELGVPGLAEKRPSLIVGDKVHAQIHKELKAYEGVIFQITNDTIKIKGFHESFADIVKNNPTVQMDVKFEVGRLTYERMHNAINLTVTGGYLSVIFPENTRFINRCPFNITESYFCNPHVFNNTEQRMAVENIINRTSGIAPFILFGPPGTGKTMTIVETIVQIIKIWKNHSRILVCAPSNAACDMLASKLIPYFTQGELCRLHSGTLDRESIPAIVREYSNRKNDARYRPADLMKFKIVICTLMLAGRFANSEYKPTCVFIDEAAQAKEPEAMVAIAGLLKPENQIVLAGDPHQLGPVCTSKEAFKKGLGKSLLTRLLEMEVYQNNNSYVVKLLQNYRSHEQILRIPNKLFYKGELRYLPNNDPIVKYDILNDKELELDQATVFHAVMAKEKREDKSPSYFNPHEIEVVMKYVKALLNLQNISKKVSQEEIGVISPYLGQVSRIRKCLEKQKYKIDVGTTEAFQGKEKRVIIVSVVRSQENLLLHDRKYRLGFVEDPERFNVAITRAKSKLIVIGNPLCMYMERDQVKKWTMYINQCIELGSRRGTLFKPRTDGCSREAAHRSANRKPRKNNKNNKTAHNDLVQRFEKVKLREILE